ncbi:MAG TPA: TylF/MycF/NovP-related O-methyltransferase [Bacteroidales bacterium]|nr:TylF/MycF/NovP-related O-methyltransferase [Bacteroidales bacterium]
MDTALWIQYLTYGLLLLLIVLGIRFLWLSITQRIHHPEQWIFRSQQRKIPDDLLALERRSDDRIRLYNFWFQTERIIKEGITGDFAELGVYKGDSAWLIHRLAPDRTLHLFDTFAGFYQPDLSMETGEASTYTWRDFADTDAGAVKARFGNTPNVLIHEGWFPDTAEEAEDCTFALVHMDADLYQPVKAGLAFFYPRLAPGGVIIVHDYTHKWEGLMRAVDEFVASIPECLVHVPDRFGSVMILKNKPLPG